MAPALDSHYLINRPLTWLSLPQGLGCLQWSVECRSTNRPSLLVRDKSPRSSALAKSSQHSYMRLARCCFSARKHSCVCLLRIPYGSPVRADHKQDWGV